MTEVPAGLTFLVAEDSDLADDQVLDLVAHVGDDGRLDSLVIDLVEQDSDTSASARIEVAYRDLDEGDPIAAPADAQPMPDMTDVFPPEVEEPLQVLTEFFEANPDVCTEDIDPNELVACLRAGGHDEAADALELIEAVGRG